ncbi:hypothetical protein [Streptomyces sp. SID13031]|uniref:hypothetical protein n=1 Tax=Streptomyces sp. SID13031 TaxID=2706046 RepID=UPI0013CA2695|nr:hypothetical protein [Streptomyces sp. SID13031]NEA36218.1 hypothetical protein [Streptomyces sp. SID13031]
MKPTEFVKVNSQFWGDHLKSVSEHLPGSHGRELVGPLLYPRQLVLTETPDWNILELVGVSREYRSLEVRRQKAASIDEYFGASGAGKPVAKLPNENFYRDATIATAYGNGVLTAGFPGAQRLTESELIGPAGIGDGQLLEFAPGNYSVFQRVLLASSTGTSSRVHWSFLAIAIHRSEPADKYRDFLQNLVNAAAHLDPVGTVAVPRGEVDQLLKAEPFSSTYQHGLGKATVGEFLQQHEEILLAAFDATQLIREPQLDGLDSSPDFILERADGSHIVGQLALPVLEIAKDGKKRRRSTSATDGAARLAQYGEYFAGAENREFAKTKYGVEVSNPRSVLVTSNQELIATPDGTNELVDYDTILRLALAGK